MSVPEYVHEAMREINMAMQDPEGLHKLHALRQELERVGLMLGPVTKADEVKNLVSLLLSQWSEEDMERIFSTPEMTLALIAMLITAMERYLRVFDPRKKR